MNSIRSQFESALLRLWNCFAESLYCHFDTRRGLKASKGVQGFLILAVQVLGWCRSVPSCDFGIFDLGLRFFNRESISDSNFWERMSFPKKEPSALQNRVFFSKKYETYDPVDFSQQGVLDMSDSDYKIWQREVWTCLLSFYLSLSLSVPLLISSSTIPPAFFLPGCRCFGPYFFDQSSGSRGMVCPLGNIAIVQTILSSGKNREA